MWLIIVGVIAIIIIVITYILIGASLEEQKEYERSLPLSSTAVGITFNQFYDWYQLNPKRWILLNNYVKVETARKSYDNAKICYFNSSKEWSKYKKFKESLEITKANKKFNETMLEILETVQQDIDALRKQSNQEIKKASDRWIEIAERLKER